MGRLAFRLGAAAAFVVAALVLSGCELSIGNLAGRATDEITKTFPLTPGGEVVISNTNGRIEVEAVDGSSVEVRAERIARAATDTAARELLGRVEIKEDVSPSRVSFASARPAGFLIGASIEVRYRVKAPRDAVVDLANTNGQVSVAGMKGRVKLHTTNGAITGTDLTGAIDAESTNGRIAVTLASVGTGAISLETTNGRVRLELPSTARANIDASCVNGSISASGLRLESSEQSRRRLVGRMNGGGTSITLRTTNGSISMRPSEASDSRTGDDER